MLYHLLYPLHESFAGFNVFRYITFRSIAAAVCAFLIVFFFGKMFIRAMQKRQIGQVVRDNGPETHFKKNGVPTMGGMLIIFSIIISTFCWARLDNPLVWVIMLVTLFFGAIGAYDDYKKISKNNTDGLSGKGKLFLQVLGALLVGSFVYFYPVHDSQLSIPFIKNFQPNLGVFYIAFAVLVIVGSSNAVNLTDGLDGLATGPTVVSAAVYLLFSYLAGNVVLSEYLQVAYVPGSGELAVFCGTLFGACLGFLWFNAHPAQMFMGDVGSLAIGGAIGSIAIMIKQEFLLVIVGGIFVIEALSVIIQVGYFKISGGKRIFLMAPCHHHYEKKGWAEPKIVVRFWIVSIILGLFAVATLKLR
ncbi:MAG: phospho-N-acetylmuramoyl-pentapeptide-transferase [Desulfotalea sp.]